MNQAYLLGQTAEGDEVGDPEGREDDSQEGKAGRLGLEAAGVGLRTSDRRGRTRVLRGPYHSHGFSYEVDEGLVGDGDGVRQEKEAQRDVEERQGCEDRLGRNERHLGAARQNVVLGRLQGSYIIDFQQQNHQSA